MTAMNRPPEYLLRREELKILADELLREVDAAAIDTANVSIASALEHLCELERALIALWQYADRPYADRPAPDDV